MSQPEQLNIDCSSHHAAVLSTAGWTLCCCCYCISQLDRTAVTASVLELFVILVTDWNKERRLQGQEVPGPPLNELGFQQAEVVSKLAVAVL